MPGETANVVPDASWKPETQRTFSGLQCGCYGGTLWLRRAKFNDTEPEDKHPVDKKVIDRLVTLIFVGGVILRLALFAVNPADNAFDDHFTPIIMIAEHGVLPGKLDCWECYQPPVFYVISAAIARVAFFIGMSGDQVMKFLQFMNCLYGIATLPVIYLILKKLPLSDFSRLIAFGTLCFLPRHIYMGALHSNDTLSYLTVALCIYLLLLVLDGKYDLRYLFALSVAVLSAIFTKYTALCVIPVVFATFVLMILPRYSFPPLVVLKLMLSVLAIPILILGWYMVNNAQRYGVALPFNTVLFDPASVQPRDPGDVRFFDFSPWLSIRRPIVWPGQLNSVWTLIHSGMWFDSMPKFLYLVRQENEAWWFDYFNWLNGRAPNPPTYIDGVKRIRFTGSALIALGLVPLFLIIAGVGSFFIKIVEAIRSSDWRLVTVLQMFFLLLILNLSGVIGLVIKTPVYSAMKASYLLTSLPSFAVFLALGIMLLERSALFRSVCGLFFACLYLLVFYNVSTMVLAIV